MGRRLFIPLKRGLSLRPGKNTDPGTIGKEIVGASTAKGGGSEAGAGDEASEARRPVAKTNGMTVISFVG